MRRSDNMDFFNKRTWETWANDNYSEFESLKDGARIAIMLPNTDNLIILEKGSEISVKIDDRYSFEFPFAEIGFNFNEDAVEKVLSDKTLKTFQRLTSNDEIGILSFVKEDKLIEYDYSMFLRKFGFEINTGCSCGCC